MQFDPAEIVAIIAALTALVTAYIALKKGRAEDIHTKGETRKDNSEAAHNIIEAAETAIALTRDTSSIRIAELEKIVAEFRATITSLNSQISSLRLSGETMSITLNNALSAMDSLHGQVVNLQAENIGLHKDVIRLETENSLLRAQIDSLKAGRANG